ncbi:MAG: hypothetical protein HY852_00870 [Bradyrhizobium sp.]|uniref:hypothetical protein n=1 Tax=Bradyrhizobium sp. TaxID=376 RepID=UPI0025C54BD5|nr:hypothetical protein [Bradyrhizobium sp.]MBI5260352.1 hypothetical protein [Bradyrhizobium sp.]
MFSRILTASLLLSISATVASATAVEWTLTKAPLELVGMPTDQGEEPDYVIRLTCKKGAVVQIGLGAYKDLGNGKAEPLSVTLISATQTVALSGKPAPSKNWNMTASSELRTEMPVSSMDKLSAVFATGEPITVSGAITDVWTVSAKRKKKAALKSLYRAFGEGCSKK